MEYICIGKIVNTHALKGELRIISDFEYKDKIFKNNFKLYIGKNKEKEIIQTYRKHKNFDMVKFINKDDIDDVLKYKGQYVYILKKDLNLNKEEYLICELIDMKIVFKNKHIGIVKEIINNNGYRLLNTGKFYIPLNKEFIEKIENNIIYLKNVEELIC